MSAKDKYIISPAHTASPTHSTVDTFTALPARCCRHTQHHLHAAHSTAYTYTALTTYIHTYIQQRLHTSLPIHTLIHHCLYAHSSSNKICRYWLPAVHLASTSFTCKKTTDPVLAVSLIP